MTMSDQDLEILSRPELEAILTELEANRSSRATRDLGPAFRRRPASVQGAATPKLPELRDSTTAGLEDWAKRMASRHQRKIAARLLSWDEVEVAELCETLPKTDEFLVFDTRPLAAAGFVLLARPLAFGLLSFEFGGRREATHAPTDRHYTGIERRFLWRATSNLLTSLVGYWQGGHGVEAHARSLEDPVHLLDTVPETVMLASAEISGVAGVGRVRIGIPKAPFRPATLVSAPAGEQKPELARSLSDVEIPIRVEIGTTYLTLEQLGTLAPGDELLLEPSVPDGFLISVGDVPKFHGTKGHVGGRLAIQVQHRVSQESTP
jgi:flagellar motor switch protein FliM